jgi:hypothetical protein
VACSPRITRSVAGRIGDPAARDPDTVAVRGVVKEMRDAEDLHPRAAADRRRPADGRAGSGLVLCEPAQ